MREKAYFRLDRNLTLNDHWRLNDLFDRTGAELDARDFTYGNLVEVGPAIRIHLWNSEEIVQAKFPLRFSLYNNGYPLDFNFTTDSVPVVTSKVADILESIAPNDIQRVPVVVESRETEDYEIINIISVVKCVDREASEIEWRTEADGRPDLIGRIKTALKLVVDPNRAAAANLFRLGERPGDIIISGIVKSALEEARVSGVTFLPLS